MQEVVERRAKVKRYNTDPKYKEEVDNEKRERAKAMKEPDPEVKFGSIIIPLAPFGIPEYDLGERFDLKGKYVDNGWVDEDADFFGNVAKLFGGKKKQPPADEDAPKKGSKSKRK